MALKTDILPRGGVWSVRGERWHTWHVGCYGWEGGIDSVRVRLHWTCHLSYPSFTMCVDTIWSPIGGTARVCKNDSGQHFSSAEELQSAKMTINLNLEA